MRYRCEGCGAPSAGPDEPCPWCGAGENEPPSGTSTASGVRPQPAAPPAGDAKPGVGCLLAIGAIALVFWFFSHLDDPPPRPAPPAAGAVVVLTNGYLEQSRGDPIALFTSRTALDEARKAPKNQDPEEAPAGGFLIRPGVNARILLSHPSWQQVEVSILDGPEKDRTGWVPLEKLAVTK